MNRLARAALLIALLTGAVVILSVEAGPALTDWNGVIGDDDRSPVDDTTISPYRMVVQIAASTAKKGTKLCTGWFVSPHAVVTAAHCLYYEEDGGWPTKVVLTSGLPMGEEARAKQKISVPSGCAGSARDCGALHTPACWAGKTPSEWSERTPKCDYGAIILPTPNNFEEAGASKTGPGWFSVANAAATGLRVATAGYPGDLDQAMAQYVTFGTITDVDSNFARHDLDTTGGQSGAPIWVQAGRKFDVVGIQIGTGAYCHSAIGWIGFHNCARRIDSTVTKYLRDWGALPSESDFAVPPAPPKIPVEPKTLCQSDGRVTAAFHWRPVANAKGYVLDVSLDKSFPWRGIAAPPYGEPAYEYANFDWPSAMEFTWQNLDAGKTYFWRVYAFNGSGGTHSKIASFTTPACPGAAPPAAAANAFKGWEVGIWHGPGDWEEKPGPFAADEGAIMVAPLFTNCTADREWESRWIAPNGKLVTVGNGTGGQESALCSDDYNTWRSEWASCWPGTWTREVEMNEQQYSTTFEVERAPPMELVSKGVGYGFDEDTGVLSQPTVQVTRPGTVYFVQRWRYWCGSHQWGHSLRGGGHTVDLGTQSGSPIPTLPIRETLPVPRSRGPFARYAGLTWTYWAFEFTASDLDKYRGAWTVVTKIDGVPRATQGILVGR